MRCLFFCLCFLCLLAPQLYSNDWGALEDFVKNKTAPYAMNLFIAGVPIRYSISDEITPREERLFVENMAKWPQTVLTYIREANREDEFEDIISSLTQPLVLERVEEKPHITLAIGHKICGSTTALGCFLNPQGNAPAEIVIEKRARADFRAISLHEIGHFYGLADQYKGGLFNADAEYSSDVNTKQGSVMNKKGQLTCDDVDGFINVLDLRLAQANNNQFSKRAQKGWKTFCPDSENVYVESRTINRQQAGYIVRDVPWNKNLLVMAYDKGKVNSYMVNRLAWLLPFYVEENSVIVRNEETGLITSIETPVRHQGHEPYFWKREFTYLPADEPTHILITDKIDDFITTRRIKLGKDGSARGKDFVLSPKIYKERLYNHEEKTRLMEAVRIHHTKGEIEVFEIEDFGKVASLAGQRTGPNTFKFTADVDGKPLNCQGSIHPEGDCAKLSDLWDKFLIYKQNLESFYQNFYIPLKQKKLEEKTIKELQKELRLSDTPRKFKPKNPSVK